MRSILEKVRTGLPVKPKAKHASSENLVCNYADNYYGDRCCQNAK